jgi:hypothetical protein
MNPELFHPVMKGQWRNCHRFFKLVSNLIAKFAMAVSMRRELLEIPGGTVQNIQNYCRGIN